MITVQADGSFANTQRFLRRLTSQDLYNLLDKYGRQGVEALRAATPVGTGETANSWTYTINQSRGSHEVVWSNTHKVNGVNIAILIQYGHGTGTGGYVPGRDYINPALKPIFDQILAEIRRVVKA